MWGSSQRLTSAATRAKYIIRRPRRLSGALIVFLYLPTDGLMRLKIEEPTRFSLCRLLQFPGGRRNAGDTCPGLKPASREMTKLDPVSARTGLSRRNFAPRCTSAVAVDCSQGGHFIDRIWAPFSPRTQTAIVFVPNHFATKSTHD